MPRVIGVKKYLANEKTLKAEVAAQRASFLHGTPYVSTDVTINQEVYYSSGEWLGKVLKDLSKAFPSDKKRGEGHARSRAPQSPWRPLKPEIHFAFDDFKDNVIDAYRRSLEVIGQRAVTYMARRMQRGNYRPYLSKRQSLYTNKGLTMTQSPAKVPRIFELMYLRHELKSSVAQYGPKHRKSQTLIHQVNEAKRRAEHFTVRVRTPEAYKLNRPGDVYSTGSSWRKSWRIKGGYAGEAFLKGKQRTSMRIGFLKESGFGLIHWSAAPGQFPAPDTERLKRSLRYDIVPSADGMYSLRIGGYTEYARALELGTSTMAARPFVRPTIEFFKGKLAEEIEKQMLATSGQSQSRYGAHPIEPSGGIPSGFNELTWTMELANRAKQHGINMFRELRSLRLHGLVGGV
jgi:HK97 gp10 family phage protein